ncbi:FAD/NAD(P)-binding protein [Paeniglutamicibacter sp. NPDC012692]|uniref:FAD/NAD(P)-binding protein n=1 Tax=Paeniglutamicibacter sp. NPDC012692 TaxID=3364388 RepID=UPI0036817414
MSLPPRTTHGPVGRSSIDNPASSLLIVGGGPRAAMLLERVAANHRELGVDSLHIDVVDPFPPGAGRIWRGDQSPLLKLNSMAMDVSMFTDASVTCEGPAVPGPSLWEWVCQVRAGTCPGIDTASFAPGSALGEEIAALGADSFPTRKLHSHYLEWFLARAVAALPDGIEVAFRQDTVVDILPGAPGALHRIELASGASLEADQVVLAQGHTDALPDAPSRRFARFAADNQARLTYIPPDYTNDVDLSGLRPGTDVLVSGMGLAFVDLFVLLMQGRGGSFTARPDGSLTYEPSGKEPRLLVGSRRGVPYLSKIRGGLRGEPGKGLRFLTAQAVDRLRQRHGLLDFRIHLWPLVAKDAAYGYYRELLTASPERANVPWTEFADLFAPLDWYSPEREALVDRAIPDPRDRLDFEALDHPLAAREFVTPDQVQSAVREAVATDIALRDGGENSETLGLFLGLLGCYMELGRIISLDDLHESSRRDVSGWWHGFFSYVDSGPPASRLRELLALERAGLIRFLGPRTTFDIDPDGRCFVARGAVDGHVARAEAFVEARLPASTLETTSNPLLLALFARGLITQEPSGTGKLLVDDEYRAVDGQGSACPWLYAVGAGISGWSAGAFSRPLSNAAPFRDTDALARLVLTSIPKPVARPEPTFMSETALAACIDSVHRYVG